MQPRTLEQILSEYSSIYQPSIEYLRQRQAQAPQQATADIAAAEAAQTKAYEDILTGARRRGLGFAGIPLGEQAQYASQVFAPAVLAARQKATETGQGLESSILALQAEARQQAIARRNAEEDLARQIAASGRGGGGGSVDTSSSVLAQLLAYLGGGTATAQAQRPSLASIFGTPPATATQPQIRVTAPTQATVLQPATSVRLQPTAPTVQPAGGISLQSSGLRLQGGIPLSTSGLRVR